MSNDPNVTIKVLRSKHPEWTWRCEHYGLGYRYFGTRGDETVTVWAEAWIINDINTSDEYETRWRIDNGTRVESFWDWSFRHELSASLRDSITNLWKTV